MEKFIGTTGITLTDLSDAIISSATPASTKEGQLWIDTSKTPPQLKVYKNGRWLIQELDITQMDEGFATKVEAIIETIGSIVNDNKLTYSDRIILMNELNKVVGRVLSTSLTDNFTTGLPTIEQIDASEQGSLAVSRKSAVRIGIDPRSTLYTNTATSWTDLTVFLNGLKDINNGVNAWDITHTNQDIVIDIDGDLFREKMLTFYNAMLVLEGEILSVPGPEGQAAINMILSNESITVATDDNGQHGDYSYAFTDIDIHEGTAKVTGDWIIKVNSKSPEVIGVLSGNRYSITEITGYSQNTYVEFKASREGYVDIYKRLSVSKAMTGEAAINEWITVSSNIINRNKTGYMSPSKLTAETKRRIGGGDILPFKGFFIIYEFKEGSESIVYDTTTDKPDGESLVEWTPTSSDISYLRFELYLNNRMVDMQTVVVLSDGIDAVSPLTISVDNDTIVIPSNPDGTLFANSLIEADVTALAYRGDNVVNTVGQQSEYFIHFIEETEGLLGSITTDSSSMQNKYTVTDLTVDKAVLKVILIHRATGAEYASRKVTIVKNKNGESGVFHWVDVPKVITIKYDTAGNAIYTPSSFGIYSYVTVGQEPRKLDPDIKTIDIYSQDVINDIDTKLKTINNGSEVNTLNLLQSLNTDRDYRDFRFYVAINRGTVVEKEYIEVIADGRHGQSQYFFIKYADQPDGTGMTDILDDPLYIGVLVTDIPVKSENKDDYAWYKFKGEQGVEGSDGSKLHIKYSNDGGLTFTQEPGKTPGESMGSWIGMYVDFIEEDSLNVEDYTWNRINAIDAITGYLTNESITLGSTNTGTVPFFQGSEGTFEVYDGINYKTTTGEVTYSVVEQNDIVIEIDINGNYVVTGMTGGTSVLNGNATLRATYNGIEIDKVVSVSKSMAGTSGVGIKATVISYQNHTDGITPPTGTWSLEKLPLEKGKYYWVRTDTTYTDDISVTTYSVNYIATDGKTAYEIAVDNGFEGTEAEWVESLQAIGSYKIELISSNGTAFKNGIVNTVIRAIVYYGTDDVTSTLPASKFKWTRISSDSAGDVIWNNRHASGAKEITVTRSDIKKLASFRCDIIE